MKKKPIIEIKINNWTKRTFKEQVEASMWIDRLMVDLMNRYRKSGVADDFTGRSNP